MILRSLTENIQQIKHANLKMDRRIEYRISVKAMKDTMGPNRLVPSYLAFGCVPRFSAVDSKLPDQHFCMDALSRGRQEMATIVAEMRKHKALASRVPRNAYLAI